MSDGPSPTAAQRESAGGLAFVKGHGTGNDFVLLADPRGELRLPAALVRALCDRRTGIGADGVLRVVATAAAPEVAALAGQAAWFMDYRNADGSPAEMCGNGIRVYARYLVDCGALPPGRHAFATRGGIREVTVPAVGDVRVDMGPVGIAGTAPVRVGGRPLSGLVVSLGNPHLACLVDGPLDAFDLGRPPDTDRADFPDGVNVELVQPDGDRRLRMRVYERGVGETRSCGTGACAAAAAAAQASGVDGAQWTVEVPGGRLVVELADGHATLTGPAVLVARGELDAAWLAANAGGG